MTLREGLAPDKLNGEQMEQLGRSIVEDEARVSGPCDHELRGILEKMTVADVRKFRSNLTAQKHVVDKETAARKSAIDRLLEIVGKVIS